MAESGYGWGTSGLEVGVGEFNLFAPHGGEGLAGACGTVSVTDGLAQGWIFGFEDPSAVPASFFAYTTNDFHDTLLEARLHSPGQGSCHGAEGWVQVALSRSG